ncbi:MAG TPA: uroporphyrinogen-III C-methyltransferase [Syntrophomonadaceae bacterium]|nr:uroporphyrinogen-III C-methyltransferase [Syntrophomonadaceae bacterium]
MRKGIVYLIGAGPGDPGLFTIKGHSLLKEAEVVVYDRLVNSDILSCIREDAELIYVGKASSNHALSQDEINQLLVEKLAAGKKVARLKGGDPFLFGRGGEEAEFVRNHGFDYEVVPGVTSAIAVPAYAGIPVTHRDAASSIAIITGHEKPGKQNSSIKWKELANGADTLVFLMGIENLGFITRQLMENGKSADTPVALVRWGTLPDQEVLTGTLENINHKMEESEFLPPAVTIIGNVVNLRNQLAWVEKRPLWGKRIVITRARTQASALANQLRELGADVIEFPTIKINQESDLSQLHYALSNIESYAWIIFTSVNGVDIFFDEMIKFGLDIRCLQGISICAIGPATRESLRKRGIRADIVPSEFRAEGLIEELQKNIKPGQSVLLPRAGGARAILPESIRDLGAHVSEINLYRAEPVSYIGNKVIDQIVNRQIDLITFTSSSTVHNFVDIIGQENVDKLTDVKIGCIGPITADTARDYGFTVAITAGEYTIAGLVQAILEHYL